MLSRMQGFWNKTFHDEKGNLKQSQEYCILQKAYSFEEISILLQWRDGRLNDDEEQPAVEFQDAHIEHYQNGLLPKAEDGFLTPAIIANYGKNFEYWLYGKQVQQP